MIITKKALPRRTFLRGAGRHAGAAAARRHGSGPDRAGRHAGQSGAPPGLRLHPDGLEHRAVDSARREGTLTELSPISAARSRRSSDQLTVHHQPGAEERLSRHARDLERRLPERGHGEADREHRLRARHHGRSDRRAADRPGDRSCRRSSSRWICSPRSASATTATPASIRTISPGRRRPRRCPPRRIRASCSSACSAMAAARPSAAPSCARTPACSIR